MTQGFFQFNKSIINQILNFATSTFDLLFLAGVKGSSKSETLNKAITMLGDDFLVFQHFCFSNSVIDDFLLNFYDELRSFVLAQKISLKKYPSDNFKEKVSHYFKTINSNCIITVENFENVEDNLEIINFLSVLANFENVKIIIVSRNPEKNLFRFKKIKMQTLNFLPIDKEEFKSKITALYEQVDNAFCDKFYSITKGLELYLKMSLKYCSLTAVNLPDLVDEYERKHNSLNIDFEEFIVSKFISITPSVYRDMFKIMCTLEHPVSMEFLKEYNLANADYTAYLSQNFLLSSFKDEFYVKDYFKQYIVKNFSIKEKINYYRKIIEIYENELTKSPADRLVRLSRESIRKLVNYYENSIPQIKHTSDSKAFSYLGMSSVSNSDEKTRQKEKLAQKLNKIKERKNALMENINSSDDENEQIVEIRENVFEKQRETRLSVVKLIDSAKEFTKNYKYQQAIDELLRADEVDVEDFRIDILLDIAKNYEYLTNYQEAQSYYSKALDNAVSLSDKRIGEIQLAIALIDKNLYKIDKAKEKFEIISKNIDFSEIIRAKAYLELAEINEVNSDINSAIENYENSIELIKDKDIELLCKSYYKLAVLYDENQDTERAVEFYQKNYMTSTDRKENKYCGSSLTNLAVINLEQSNWTRAKDYFKLALYYDSEVNDFENMYFSQKELAKLCARLGDAEAGEYFKQALNSAQKLNDIFKQALIYFEAGEFYYDKQEDKKALMNFINAKNALKNSSDTENIARINSRINDIKVRMDIESFKTILERYDNT